ncbi:hypothetical protein GF359_07145 [candidate division WOR-3 bacterium]|uniref:KAP NTPase domain-containing protein n=1 Tax=candidate division WOR-3 bacterium TaxID=2052148 RepID=A0A9D5KB89_UNCW3|nr:hypothetical protein [candidate division WOR-3 bacterium]MBD3364975.1 hypothetical protein [candidate division WOR-3 bacterium]
MKDSSNPITINYFRHSEIKTIEEDKFGFEDLISKFVNDLQATKPPYVIAVTGEWGVGKSSFLDCLKQGIKGGDNLEVIGRIELWKFSERMDLSLALVSAVIDHFGGLKSKIKNTGKKLLETLDTLLSSTTIGIPGFLSFKPSGGKIYNIWKRAEKELHEEFEVLVSRCLNDKKKTKLVVLIDDLDRCLPDKALQFLENLRFFFNSERVIFVVALDEVVIADAITARFGKDTEVDGYWYLEKLVDRWFRIPIPDDDKIKSFLIQKYTSLVEQEAPKEYKQMLDDMWSGSKLDIIRSSKNPRRVISTLQRMVEFALKFEEPEFRKYVFYDLPFFILKGVAPLLYQYGKQDGQLIVDFAESTPMARDRLNFRYGEQLQSFYLKKDIQYICQQIRGCVTGDSLFQSEEIEIQQLLRTYDFEENPMTIYMVGRRR